MRKMFVGAAVLAGLAAYPLLAQVDAPKDRAARIDARATAMFGNLDTNKDGVVTKAEVEAARAKRWAAIEERRTAMRNRAFDRLDANKDGNISKQEFAAAPPPPPPPGDRMAGRMPPRRGDMPPPPPGADGKGPPPMGDRMAMGHRGPGGPGGPGRFGPLGEHWFDRVDANKDGKVTLAEAKKAAQEHAEHRFAMRNDRHGPRGPMGPDGDVPPRAWKAE